VVSEGNDMKTELFFGAIGKQSKGFTLVELMVVLAIAALLLVVAVPSFTDTAARAAIRSGMQDLAADLAYARSSAVTRNRSVSVCASDSATTPRTCDGSAWQKGWITFFDADENGALDAGEDIVRMANAISERVNITLDNAVTFDGRGTKTTVSEFKFCASHSNNAAYAQAVLVNIGGLVRHSRDTDGDGIDNAGEGGGNLSCP